MSAVTGQNNTKINKPANGFYIYNISILDHANSYIRVGFLFASYSTCSGYVWRSPIGIFREFFSQVFLFVAISRIKWA